MTKRYKPKNLTLIEVLVVSLVCLFLLAVVPPACRKPRSDSIRITCAKNLSVIGKAMLIYANDYGGEFPRAGGRNSMWDRSVRWGVADRFGAFGLSRGGRGGMANITSSFYLLVKYTEVAPKYFICPGDTGTTEFKLSELTNIPTNFKLIDAWDFGPDASRHCSYSYQMPYGLYALTTSSEPGLAVAADRNPWIKSPSAGGKSAYLLSSYNPEGGKDAIKIGNAIAHQEEGQNVLFLDGHVSFEESPFCGISDDNIYTYWDGGDIRIGGLPILGATEPGHRLDSFLVNESAPYKKTVTKQPKAIDSNDLKQTSVIATLDCPVPEHRNVIWCSTFQMAWDGLKNDIIAEPVKVLGAEELAARLNKAEASTGDLEEESFYATAGFVKNGIIEQIQKEMARRLPSEPRPVFDELDRLQPEIKEETIVAYSYLNVDVGFKYPFHTNNSAFTFQDPNGTRTDVTSFHIGEGGLSLEISEQIDVLYYKRGEQRNTAEYVVDLCKYTSPYQVVLALVPRRNTLRETLATVEQKISEFKRDPHYEQLRKLRPARGTFQPDDSVIVPDILYKLTHQFEELKGKLIKNQEFLDYWFLVVEQMIDFALSRTGVTLKSQARLGSPPPAGRMVLPRQLYFNKPFLVYVKKRGPDKSPFFVMWVDNAELMKEF